MGRLAVLLPDGAGASVGAGHGSEAEAVRGGGSAHGADGGLPLVGCTEWKKQSRVSSEAERNIVPSRARASSSAWV